MRNHIIPVKGQKKLSQTNDFATIALMTTNPGHRMKSYGPISLLPFGSRALIDIQIEAIRAVYKDFELVVCCGFEINKIVKYIKSKYKNLNIRFVENQYYEDSSCCESLKLLLNNVNTDNIFICNGETLLFPEMLQRYRDESYLITQEKHSKKNELELGTITNDEVVHSVGFDLPNTWSESFYLYGSQPIEYMRRIVSSDMFTNKLIFEAINEFCQSKYSLKETKIDHFTNKINNIKTYHRIRDIYERDSSQLFIRNIV